jgi:hypothetical protein
MIDNHTSDIQSLNIYTIWKQFYCKEVDATIQLLGTKADNNLNQPTQSTEENPSEKLIITQLVKKHPFYGIYIFITMFTRARYI